MYFNFYVFRIEQKNSNARIFGIIVLIDFNSEWNKWYSYVGESYELEVFNFRFSYQREINDNLESFWKQNKGKNIFCSNTYNF